MRRYEKFGVGTTVVLVVLGLFLVVGLWQDWFGFSVSRDEGTTQDRVNLTVTINKDGMSDDVGKFKDETQEFVESAKTVAELESVDGVVSNIDLNRQVLTVKMKDDRVAVFVDGSTDILDDDSELELKDLKQGDTVAVVYRERDGIRRAQKVKIIERRPRP